MRTQTEKAKLFRALHERPGAFIIPNPWDAGTRKLLAAMGFEALATTSLGVANTLGRVDGEPRRHHRELPDHRRSNRAAGQRRSRERRRA